MKRLVYISLVFLLAACDGGQQDVAQQAPAAPVAPAVPVDVAAEVNGEVITRPEVEQMALDMFGEYQASAMDPAAKQKLLESMVSSLLLSQKALQELPQEERARIENKTRRYRENLLVSEYVRLHMTPQPVTESMIQQYYDNNPSQFGASELRKYQLITVRRPLALDQRNAFLKRFAELKSEATLQAMHLKFIDSGFETSYQTGVAEPGLLSSRLQQLIDSQTPGKLSDVHFIDDLPYLVLVDEVLQKQAKPLSQVRDGIRKTLAMAQLKQAVKSLSESARQQASVKIHQ
ncbi:MAG: hypothetical protein GY916_01235 [Gammaproteobacteria bacterium]|nr:hypothetical protein [Gammaproteobacteria bacterium]MCP4924549.1 hypothetical protein [Gammaproteobacteria bacterium]